MKIVSIDYDSINVVSGIATFNKNLHNIFSEDISFLTFYKGKKIYSYPEVNLGLSRSLLFKCFNYISGYRISAFIFYRNLLRMKPHIVIVNSPSLVRYLPKDLKTILVQHQDFSLMLKNKSNFGSVKKFNRIINKVDKFVLLSPYDQELVASYSSDDQQKKLISIRHMYSQYEDINTENKTFTKSLVMVGRLDIKQKRQDLAILAMKMVPEWSLSIFGNGPDYAKLVKLIRVNNIKNVFLKGSSNNIKKELLSYDIHVMTSDFEGYPFTNIEAMSIGLPLIVRDTFTSARDVVSDNGVLLDKNWSEDAFVEALKYIEANYKQLSLNSLSNAKNYNKSIIGTQWKSLISALSFDGK